LADLRLLGRNLHVQRFPGLRGRAWSEALKAAMHQHMRPSEGQPLSLTFEVVYGHAFRPVPRTRIAGESHVSLTDMRQQVLTRLRVNEA
jgi:malonyl-CoA O-methyltransferase